MKFKFSVAVLLILLSIGCFVLNASADMLTLYDNELSSSKFKIKYGTATFTRSNQAGGGVIFNFSGLTGSGTAVTDDWPVSNVGQILPSHGNGDFSKFNTYEMLVTNLDASPVAFSLLLNTGFTGPSGTPANDWTNDTFWQSPWVDINPQQKIRVVLDFNNAIPWEIGDNKSPHTQGTNGVSTAINAFDRSEVSNLGFQVAVWNSNPDASILVQPVPVPSTILLLGSGLLGFAARRKFFHR